MRRLSSQKGFSLIELMIVVAIIGILASIAVPNFQRFQAKSKQSEAKTNLAAIYSAEKGFQAEWTMYSGILQVIGFSPEGALRYETGFAGDGPTLPDNYTGVTAGDNLASDVCAASGLCSIIGGANDPTGTLPAGASDPTETEFVAGAYGDIDGDATFDEWTVDQAKTFDNTATDLAD